MISLISLWRRLQTLLDHAPPWWLCIYLFCVCILVFVLTWSEVVGGDSPGIAYLPVSILRYGTLRLDPFVDQNPFFDVSRDPHYLIESGGHYYSKFSVIPSLLALPIYALSFGLVGTPAEDIHIEAAWYIGLSRLSSSVLAALIVAVIFLILRHVIRQSGALLLALGYAFGTFTWASATNTLASQSSGEIFVTLALLILLPSADPSREVKVRAGHYSAVGCFLALGVASRPQILPIAAVLTAYVLHQTWGDRPKGLAYFAGGLPIGILWLAYNQWAFGSPLTTGYGSEALHGWSTSLWIGLPGILFSPSHGLLMYAPLLMLSVCGIATLWKRAASPESTDRELSGMVQIGLYVAAALIVQVLVMSQWHAWHGGVAFTQRMLQEAHPLCILLVAIGIRTSDEHLAVRLLSWATALWGAALNVLRIAFYDQHLAWVEVFHPELVWSVAHSEPILYFQWHGMPAFVVVPLGVAVRVLLIISIATALLIRLLHLRLLPSVRRRSPA